MTCAYQALFTAVALCFTSVYCLHQMGVVSACPVVQYKVQLVQASSTLTLFLVADACTEVSQTHADDFLALSEDGKSIKRMPKYQRLTIAEQGFCKATKAVEISLQLASGSGNSGVLVPADVRCGLLTYHHVQPA